MTQLGEYIKMALKNIWANKMRTILTMLGIIIGISSVIMVVSIGNGVAHSVEDELSDFNQGIVNFYLGSEAWNHVEYWLNEEDMEGLRNLESVKAASGYRNSLDGSVLSKKGKFDVTLKPMLPEDFDESNGKGVADHNYLVGSPYTEADVQAGKMVAVIGEEDAMELFGSVNVVGMDLEIEPTEARAVPQTITIVGVTEKEETNMLESLYMDPNMELIVPPKVISKIVGYDDDYLNYFSVMKEDEADIKQMCTDVIDYLETKHHCKGKEMYDYYSVADDIQDVNNALSVVTIFVAFVASISLLVGGIGVMNIMLVSVTERTREIGIRKALGAKTGSITVQFLAESAFITLLGGVIGILLGIGGASLITKGIAMAQPALTLSPHLELSTVLAATIFSTLVGLFFGIYPARKAAKLNPIEALRRE